MSIADEAAESGEGLEPKGEGHALDGGRFHIGCPGRPPEHSHDCGHMLRARPTGQGRHRRMAPPLQHRPTAQCPWMETAGPGNHRSDGPEANHALTFKLNHSVGANPTVDKRLPFQCPYRAQKTGDAGEATREVSPEPNPWSGTRRTALPWTPCVWEPGRGCANSWRPRQRRCPAARQCQRRASPSPRRRWRPLA